jgi:hypothetical protein
MTIDRMTLKALIEKGSDDDLLREMMTELLPVSRTRGLGVKVKPEVAHAEAEFQS